MQIMTISLLLQICFLVFIYMTAIFFLALYKKNNSLVDIAWGIGFILIAFYTLIHDDHFFSRQLLVTAMVFLWGIRLSTHIFLRNKNKDEDPRYARWRREWVNNFILRSFFQIFMLQGFVMFIVVLPIIRINSSINPNLNFLDLLGFCIWLIGFLFESIGDFQLSKFIRNPANHGKIMKQGLWRYTRHPNYFGEITLWWAIYCLALAVPYGWITIISPITITFLLLYVSGIPMLEKQFEDNQEFQRYKRETSALFPWFVNQKIYDYFN